jgi:hypothetical protein
VTVVSTIRAIIIPVDAAKPVERTEIEAELATMQQMVGGDIEMLEHPDDPLASAVFSAEGKLTSLPRNERATQALAGNMLPGDYIAGDCILVGLNAQDGELCHVPDGITVPS